MQASLPRLAYTAQPRIPKCVSVRYGIICGRRLRPAMWGCAVAHQVAAGPKRADRSGAAFSPGGAASHNARPAPNNGPDPFVYSWLAFGAGRSLQPAPVLDS